MKRRYRKNPAVVTSAIAPFLPYIIIGAVVYFWGDKIFALLGSKLTGKSLPAYKEDIKTVKEGLSAPVTTAKGLVISTTGWGYISPEEQKKAIAEIAKRQGIKVSDIKLPYPVPQSQEQFRANIEAIKKAKGF